MVLVLSDLGPRCCENRDLPAPRSNNDQDKTGYISMKKHLHPRTEEDGGADQDNTEFSRKKKVKKSSPKTEADSFSSDHSYFVALVKASNLQNDALEESAKIKAAGKAWYQTMTSDSDYTEFDNFTKWLGVNQ